MHLQKRDYEKVWIDGECAGQITIVNGLKNRTLVTRIRYIDIVMFDDISEGKTGTLLWQAV